MAAHIPYELMEVGNKATKIDSHLIPQPDQAASDYRQNGGRITDPQDSSNDPLFNDPIKKDISHLLKGFLHLKLFFIILSMKTPLFLLKL